MNKTNLIKFIDLFSFIDLIALISTGALLKFSLPPRSGGASIWGLTRHEWGDIHFYVSVLFLVLMSAHFLLHIKFIKAAITGKATREQSYRLVIGIVSILVLIAFLMSPVFSPVEDEGVKGGRYQESRQ